MKHNSRHVFGCSWGRAVVAIALLLAIGPAVPPVDADQSRESRGRQHSGTIIGADAKTITLEEIGPWTSKQSGLVRRSIELTPATKIEQVERSRAAAPGQWPGGFKEMPMAASDLRPGEHATVVTRMEHGRLVAREITIVRFTLDTEATKP